MAELDLTPCSVCQRVPTLTKTIRRHVGMVLLQRFVRISNIGVLSAYKALPEPGFGSAPPRSPDNGLARGASLPPPPPPPGR